MYDLYSKKYGSPKEGDILITGVGTLGITYLVKKDDRFYFKDGNIIWLKKKQSNINSAYIEFIFKSPFVKAQITNSIGATVGTLTIQKAKELLIPYPSPDTQNEIMKKINNIFISLNNYEDNLKKIINNYYALKNNLIKYFLIDKSV
jgi:type I restriction enzyme S subunit